MKTRQRSVRIFEIITNNYDKFLKFISSRGSILEKYLLIVRTKNEDIKNYLKNSNFEYQIVKYDFEASNTPIEIEDSCKKEEKQNKNEEKIEKNCIKTEIFDKIIRSGEEINSENRLIFLKRINAGAKIVSNEAIELFDEVEGIVICNGDYMIVKNNQKGTILFNNMEIKVNKLSFISKDGIKEL
ncbi:MAG: septum formation inhibitor [Nautilia sp.]|nr:MAG: septum formation inhibitor [Nautilia sp.]